MIAPTFERNNQRLNQRRKNANDKQWYKDQANMLDKNSFNQNQFFGLGPVSNTRRKKVNYDLMNNIIDMKDFEYVCRPYGSQVGELPASFTNRDIVSGKIKVMLGIEMKMPFSWKAVAVNTDATTRKEQHETDLLKEFVVGQIMRPLRQSIEEQTLAQQKGRKLSPEEQDQLEQQIAEQTQAKTPDEVGKYMTSEHQDPAEQLAHQLLEYLILKEKVADKFNKGFKHMNLSGENLYYVGIINGEPALRVVNPLFFDYAQSPDLDYIEDSEWAVCEYRMTPSDVVANFGSELTTDEIDRIYQFNNDSSRITDADFSFSTYDNVNDAYTVRVVHTTWKSLMKIGFLTYLDKFGTPQSKIVDENYKINEEAGDLKIEWEWIPQAHECWKILSDIFVYARPCPGQYKDLDNLYVCKLPYYGAACDNLNSVTTAPMDRMKGYQYYYDVILYRIELLMASDKGKIMAMNPKLIPKSSGLTTEKFLYFMEANKIAFVNPQEEGNKGSGADIANSVKEIDLSLAADIAKYIEFAEYIERKCGESIGVTKQMEGAIGPNEAVTNTKQNLIQSSHIIQPYFELHNNIKANVLNALLETAKVAYAGSKPRKLTYVLDDMSVKMLTIDPELLDNSTYGVFLSNSSKAADAKQAVEVLAQAAMQNQQADFADIIRVVRSESVTEAENLLEAARRRKVQEDQAIEREKIAAQQRAEKLAAAAKKEDQKHEADMIVLKEKERRKTVVQQQAILSAGFNEDKDLDDDGEPDVLEIARDGVDADIKQRKQLLEESKFVHQVGVDNKKLELEDKKIKAQKAKAASKSAA